MGIPKYTIQHMILCAKNKNGKCLSSHYVSKEMDWKCKEGHIFRAPPASVRRGRWCPECKRITISKRQRKYSILDMQKIASQKQGRCLSLEYQNGKSILEWQCADGHKWKANASSVMHNQSWCPYCVSHVNEEKCRFILQECFQIPFPKNRQALPGRLELDGYSDKLNLAFEYQGQQHYRKTFPWCNLKKQKARDLLKLQLCQEYGIILIVIPYFESKALQLFVENKINTLNLTPKIYPSLIDMSKFKGVRSYLKEVKDIAQKKGGKCKSDCYENAKTPLLFECQRKHKWLASPDNIKNGQWCPICAGNQKFTITAARELAKLRGGKCLETNYVNSKTKMEWECKCGNQWLAKYTDVKQGKWCPRCGAKQRWKTRRLRLNNGI